ncbi:MAG: MucR family transcriptional regulator [Novosphingobium sp.]
MPDIEKTTDIAALTVQLLSAYLSNNTVASEDLSGLIRSTKAALTDETVVEPVAEDTSAYTPAVSVRKSQASSEHLLSLIDGKPYKTLKRHLASHGLTPEAYRNRYNLPASYPMVAPDFSAKRRAIAEKIGLGNRQQAVTSDSASALENTKVSSKGRGSRKSSSKDAASTRSHGKENAAVTPPVETVVSTDTPKARRAMGKSGTTRASELSVPAEAVAEQATAAALLKGARVKKTKESAATTAAKSKRRSAGFATTGGVVVEPAPAVTEGAPAKPAPKRRGKLGLFGKGVASQKGAIPEATGTDDAQESKGDTLAGGKPRGAGKPKRMARTPKGTPSDAA